MNPPYSVLVDAAPGLGSGTFRSLGSALRSGDDDRLAQLAEAEPADERDELLALLEIHDLWTAPLSVTQGREWYQSHPDVAALKRRLERRFMERLDHRIAPTLAGLPEDTVVAIRSLAANDLVPAVYRWLAEAASWGELVRFLAIEGGPDAGFDDLVATAQIGIRGTAKVALARNYWDELGRGSPGEVHTVLHDRLVEATAMPRIPRERQPIAALERTAISGLLASNRALQPEMIGALGLLELQAGPRCRAVVAALQRLGAPEGALPFYEEHARADPRHGKEWLDEVVIPLAAADPPWGPRMVRGALWRDSVNSRFFASARAFSEE
jgi:hypothetical protein